MDDITRSDPPAVAPISALRARLGGVTIPHWARRPGVAPRLLALGLMRHAGLELLAGTFAPVLLTLAALWAAGDRLHLTAIALLCETLVLAHVGLCLLASTTAEPTAPAERDTADASEALIVVSRLVGVIALVVACAALVPLASLAGMRLIALAAVGFVVSLLAIAARMTRLRQLPLNALLAVGLGPGLALAVVFTQGRALTGGLALLTGGLGALFAVALAERRAHSGGATSDLDATMWQAVARAGWALLLLIGFLTACLSALTWRPLAGVIVCLLLLPVVLLSATSVGRARGQRAISLAARAVFQAHWMLCALMLVGLVGWGALSRWVF